MCVCACVCVCVFPCVCVRVFVCTNMEKEQDEIRNWQDHSPSGYL